MNLQEFSKVNESRCHRWHDGKPWSLSDWATAVAGELGEACNLIKKLNRLRDGVAGNEGRELDQVFLRLCLAEELADTFTYLDLLATAAGVDLAKAVAMKFNAVSAKNGFPERIAVGRCPCGNEVFHANQHDMNGTLICDLCWDRHRHRCSECFGKSSDCGVCGGAGEVFRKGDQ